MIFDNDAIIKANRLTRSCGTTNPYRIAQELGIQIFYMDLSSIKRNVCLCLRNRYIVLNNNLGEVEQRIVLAMNWGTTSCIGLLLSMRLQTADSGYMKRIEEIDEITFLLNC